jgi:hypothetical protein
LLARAWVRVQQLGEKPGPRLDMVPTALRVTRGSARNPAGSLRGSPACAGLRSPLIRLAKLRPGE